MVCARLRMTCIEGLPCCFGLTPRTPYHTYRVRNDEDKTGQIAHIMDICLIYLMFELRVQVSAILARKTVTKVRLFDRGVLHG